MYVCCNMLANVHADMYICILSIIGFVYFYFVVSKCKWNYAKKNKNSNKLNKTKKLIKYKYTYIHSLRAAYLDGKYFK